MNDLRKRVCELAGDGEGLVFFGPPEIFDDAILGVARRIGMETVVVYDQSKVISNMMAEDGDELSAIEHFEYNTIGSYVGERTPIFVTLLEDGNGNEKQPGQIRLLPERGT
jgi:hypothetical protein